jgi:hypothetical protein
LHVYFILAKIFQQLEEFIVQGMKCTPLHQCHSRGGIMKDVILLRGKYRLGMRIREDQRFRGTMKSLETGYSPQSLITCNLSTIGSFW